jgi:hypothetical protein
MNREIQWQVEILLVLVFQILNRTRDKYLLIKRSKIKMINKFLKIANKICLVIVID